MTFSAARNGLKAALLLLPIITISAHGLVTTTAVPGPAEMPIFGPTGMHLLTGHWAAVYANPANQGGPFELVPFGLAALMHVHGELAWTATYACWMFVLALAVTTTVCAFTTAEGDVTGWQRPVYRAAFAGAAAVLVGMIPNAFDVGHPAQLMVPLFWLVAACAARDGRFGLTGALVGLSMGWEVWGVLGIPVVLCGERVRLRAFALGLFASAGALYVPFAVSGGFAMSSFAWPVRSGTLIHQLAPGLTAFPWTLRLLQAVCAFGAGIATAVVARRSVHRLWLVPLAVLGMRLLLDPCLYTYYWIAPCTVLLIGAMLSLSAGRRVAFASVAVYTLWLYKFATRGVSDAVAMLALTATAAVLVRLTRQPGWPAPTSRRAAVSLRPTAEAG